MMTDRRERLSQLQETKFSSTKIFEKPKPLYLSTPPVMIVLLLLSVNISWYVYQWKHGRKVSKHEPFLKIDKEMCRLLGVEYILNYMPGVYIMQLYQFQFSQSTVKCKRTWSSCVPGECNRLKIQFCQGCRGMFSSSEQESSRHQNTQTFH